MSSSAWFSKQIAKNKHRRYIQEVNIIENKINDKIEEKMMIKENTNNQPLRIAVDTGKGYTKWAYKITKTVTDADGNTSEKVISKTGTEISTVKKGEDSFLGTTYIKNTGEDEYTAYNFNVMIKAVENPDKTKNNDEHRALMQRVLAKVAKEENVTDFEVIMCMSLDQFKDEKNIEDMREFMSVGSFEIKDGSDTSVINIVNLVIEPETLVATRYAKKTKLKDTNAVLVDIGTLNVGIVPINAGKLVWEKIIAPRVGFDTMMDMFKEFTDTKGMDVQKSTLEIYVNKHQGTKEAFDVVFREFFINEYAPLLKKEIDSKGFGEFSSLIFLGGTSSKCADLIEESFKEYESVEIIKDICATVKGAYEKGCKDLDKLKS